MGDLRIRLLGGLDVDGFAPHEVGSRKARTVLKVLALARGRPVPVDRLVEIVWPAEPPARPNDQIGVLVSRLRGVLGADRFVRGDAGYALACDWLDIAALEDRVDEAAARLSTGATAAARAAADAALALVRGPLLPEDEGEWVEPVRASVDRLVARAHGLAAESALIGGDATGATAAAARALDHDPYDEAALRLLMRAQVTAGRPGSALDAYARTRARLAEDLGVSPTVETEELHTAVLRGELPSGGAGAAGRHRKGSAVPRAVGRDAELAWLDARLVEVRGGGARLVLVEGEAGIGKSTLVGAWSQDVDAFVLAANCDALGRDLSLQPVLDALAAHMAARSRDEIAALLGEERGLLGPLLGSGHVPVPGPGPTTLPDPQAHQAALFAALLAVVSRAAAARPAVLLVDDVHLAGEVTTAWLAFAARRGHRLLVLATRRLGAGGTLWADRTLTLGPLDLAAARQLVGDHRAEALHRRSGGHPLFLLALADAVDAADATIGPAETGMADAVDAADATIGPAEPGMVDAETGMVDAEPGMVDAETGDVPAAVTAAVAERLHGLGPSARTVRTAAVLGPDIDLDLLAAVLGRTPADLLDELEAATAARILVERDRGLTFGHELVREAVAASVSTSRQALLHREAARVLLTRGNAEPLAVAHHARLAGDADLAADALTAASRDAEARGDHHGALGLLDQAVALADGAPVRLARARVHLAVRDAGAAADDAEAAIAAGAGVEGFEIAGWAAYYQRDFAAARRYADEGASRAGDPALRASCLCLGGRTRQAQGELAGAEERLGEGMAKAPASLKPLAQIWLGDLRIYQGRPAEAADLVDRGLLDRSRLGHPFALGHGLMARCYAAGMAGRAGDALLATAEFVAEMDRTGEPGFRHVPAACNFRAWVLRSLGRGEEAADLNERARALTPAAGQDEPYNQGTLDLIDGALLAGDLDVATRLLGELRGLEVDAAAMIWHQRERTGLARARLALAQGEPELAAALATEVVAAAARRGSERHTRIARMVEALARTDAGEPLNHGRFERLLADLDTVAGLEAWRWAAEVARRSGTDQARRAAERRATTLLATTPADDRPALERWIDGWLQ